MCSLPDLLSSVGTRCFPKWLFPRGAGDARVREPPWSPRSRHPAVPVPVRERTEASGALRAGRVGARWAGSSGVPAGHWACRVHMTCVLHPEGLPPACVPLRSWCHLVGGGAPQRRFPGSPCTGSPPSVAGAVLAAGWGSQRRSRVL